MITIATWGFSVCVRTPTFEKPEGRTADPSTALRSGRDDKGEGGVSIEDFASGWMETAGPSTALRSGRDDTSAGGSYLAFLLRIS
jgi:hypothetical protein